MEFGTYKLVSTEPVEWAVGDDRGYFGYAVNIVGIWPEHMGFPAFSHEQMVECARKQSELDPDDARDEYAHLEYDERRNIWLECWWNETVELEPFVVDGIELFALGRWTGWSWGEPE